MRMHSVLILITAMVLGGSLATQAYAKPDKRERAERSEQHRQSHKGVLSRDDAARRAQRQYGGRVLSVDLLQSDDAPARYRIKLLTEGNVRTVDINALED